MDVFGALADPVRREIVELLAHDRVAAGAVAASVGVISRPAVSRHLRVLREARIIEATLVGRERIYRIRPDALEEVEQWLDRLRPPFEQHLDALETEVHRTRRERERHERRAAPPAPASKEQTA